MNKLLNKELQKKVTEAIKGLEEESSKINMLYSCLLSINELINDRYPDTINIARIALSDIFTNAEFEEVFGQTKEQATTMYIIDDIDSLGKHGVYDKYTVMSQSLYEIIYKFTALEVNSLYIANLSSTDNGKTIEYDIINRVDFESIEGVTVENEVGYFVVYKDDMDYLGPNNIIMDTRNPIIWSVEPKLKNSYDLCYKVKHYKLVEGEREVGIYRVLDKIEYKGDDAAVDMIVHLYSDEDYELDSDQQISGTSCVYMETKFAKPSNSKYIYKVIYKGGVVSSSAECNNMIIVDDIQFKVIGIELNNHKK